MINDKAIPFSIKVSKDYTNDDWTWLTSQLINSLGLWQLSSSQDWWNTSHFPSWHHIKKIKNGSSPIVHEDGMSFSMSGQLGRCLQTLSLAQGWSTCRGFPFPFAGVDCASTMTTVQVQRLIQAQIEALTTYVDISNPLQNQTAWRSFRVVLALFGEKSQVMFIASSRGTKPCQGFPIWDGSSWGWIFDLDFATCLWVLRASSSTEVLQNITTPCHFHLNKVSILTFL